MGVSVRDLAVAQAKRSMLRAAVSVVVTPFRVAFFLLLGAATVLADGPRFEKTPTRRPRTAAQEARQIAGAALWTAAPGLLSHFGAPLIVLVPASILATVIVGRRLRYLDPAVQSRLTIPAVHRAPWLLALILPAVAAALVPLFVAMPWLWAAGCVLVGGCIYYVALLVSSRVAATSSARAEQVVDALRVALSVPEEQAREQLKRRNGIWSMPAPAIARHRAADAAALDATVAAILPEHQIRVEGGTVYVEPASEQVLETRRQLAQSEGLVVRQTEDGGVLSMSLAPGVGPTDAERVQVYARSVLGAGAALTEWSPHEGRAVARLLSEDEARVRARLAQVLKISYPWDLAADVTSVDGRIDRIVLRKLPPGLGGISAAERLRFWADVVLSLPDGSNGWSVVEAADGVVTLTWGAPRALPAMVPLAEMLPAQLAPDAWHEIPVGRGETGNQIGFDLTLGPHAATVGPTGSGKTVALVAELAQRLVRGHRIVVIDPTKGGVDFAALEPFASGFARTFEEATELIKAVYAEGERRKALLLTHGEVKWSDLPADVRATENVGPITVVIDEIGSLLIEPEIPKSLPRDDPERAKLEELAGQKALIKLYIGKIARELRFVGIFLDLATQRPDASILGGELRSNLTSVAQLAKPGSPPTLDAIRMVFPGDSASEAFETLRALDDGHSRGLGVVAGDGGGVAGVRIAYAPMREVVALLEERGVPLGAPILSVEALVARETAAGRPQFGEIIAESEAEIADLGELDFADFDLGDLDDAPATAAPGELPPAPPAADTPGNTAPTAPAGQPPVIPSNPNDIFSDLFD